MAQTELQVAALELERVQPKVTTMFDRDGYFYAALERRPVEIVSKRDMRIPLEIRTGGNFGHWDPEGGDLGRGDAPSYDKAVITPAFLRYAVEFNTIAGWVTDDKRKAVINNVRNLIAKSMQEFRRHADSLCMTAGDGVLGTISALSNAAGVDTLTLGTDGFGARLLRYGQTVNTYTTDLLTRKGAAGSAGECKLSFHDLANKVIKIPEIGGGDGGPRIVGDKLVASGLTATPPVSMKGIPYHHSNASTGSWLGLDRAANPEIRANGVAGNSAYLTLPLPRLAMNKIGDRVGMDSMKRGQAWMHPCQVQAYEQLGFNVTQINSTGTGGEGKGLDLYYGGAMQMAGAPVKKSFSWDKTRIDFVDLDVWGRAVMHEAGFYKAPGGNGQYLFEVRGASGGVAAANIFYIVAAFDIFMSNPAGGSYISALKVPQGY